MYSRCLDFCSVTVSGWEKCSRDKDWWGNTHQNHHHPPFPSDIPLEHLVRHIRLTQKTEVLKRHRQGCVKEPAVDQIQWAMWHQGKTFWRDSSGPLPCGANGGGSQSPIKYSVRKKQDGEKLTGTLSDQRATFNTKLSLGKPGKRR